MKKNSRPRVLYAKLHFDYVSMNQKEIASIERAFLPETTDRGKCVLKSSLRKSKRETHLLLDFEATDVISLRASMNTNLRLVNSAIKTLNTIEHDPMLISERGKTEKLDKQI
jgi:tRNA threonylcarbamoyladenosine modification (KEOPS) complex  Pcc1 subunit